MGNLLACGTPIRVSSSSLGSLKPSSVAQLILSDGSIESITSPVSVAELMMEHPEQFVCHVNLEENNFDRDRPLPADARLEFGEIYYLRPKSGFDSSSKSPLRHLALSCSGSSEKGCSNSSFSKGLFRMKQKGGVTQVTVSADFVAQLLSRHDQEEQRKMKSRKNSDGILMGLGGGEEMDHGNPELQLAYQMRLVSRSVSWKPKLATIEES